MMSPFSNRLTDAADDLADALAVLRVDVLALGLADLLEDHLLGRLRRDAAEVLGRTRELDLHVDFRLVAVQLLRFSQRDLVRRVGHLVDDPLDRAQLDLAGLLIEARAQRLVLVPLAGGRLDRVLHGADDDVRLDALFLGDGVDLLEQRVLVAIYQSTGNRFPLASSQPSAASVSRRLRT